MPYFTAAHVTHALGYLPGRTHPSLVSFLGMLKAEVPISPTPSKAFGSVQETDLMRDYFRPEGGPPDRPWYVPFGAPRDSVSNWKVKDNAGKSLQRMRTGKPFIYLQGTGASNYLGSFHPDSVTVMATRGADVIGAEGPTVRKRTVALLHAMSGPGDAEVMALGRRHYVGLPVCIARKVIPRVRTPVCCVQYAAQDRHVAYNADCAP
jgi:hypothetical protein